MQGMFIVFEGLDGSGTTTQAIKLSEYLFNKDKVHAPLLTREPTCLTSFGREIRRRLENKLLPHEQQIDDFEYWANLFVNDRRWHLDNIVIPNTKLGLPVISDRHMFSTLAYQSAQGGQMEYLIEKHSGMRPADLTIFLRVPAEVALARIQANREGTPEYFEKKKDFLLRTAENYERAISLIRDKHNVVIIDGTLPIEEVAKEIQRVVDGKLK